MVYAYDQWAQLPVRDLYDSQMMAMAINAAKDMYEKGYQEMKDFKKEYGDFMTPIAADQDWYNQNVTGKVRDAINALYAQGIDPLRNAQGRAMVSQIINNMDYGTIAKLKMSSENAREYLKNKAALEAQGKYSADLEERFLGYNLAGWDTTKNGAWNRVSPTQMKSLKELTEQLYNSRTARDLTEEDLKAAGIPYDSRYQYSGYLDSDILNTAKGFTPGWNDSVYSEYYRDLAKKQLQLQGVKDPTAAQIEATLQRNIADSNQEWLINPTKKADEFALEDIRFKHNLALQRMRGNSGSSGQQKQTIAYDSAEGLFYRGLIKAGGTEHYGDVEKAVEDGRDNIVRRQIDLLKQASVVKRGAKNMGDYILDGLSIEEAPGNFSRYTQIPLTNGVMPIDKHWAQRMFSDESIISHMYGITYGTRDGSTGKSKGQYKKYTDRSDLVGKVAMPTTKVRTSFTQRANGEYALRQFWQMDVGSLADDGTFVHEKYMEFELPTSRAATHNMPAYSKYKKMNELDQNVIVRPSLSEDPTTLGWKNTGSMQVNQFEHVPSNIGFPGTSNNEAYELP